MPEFLDLHLEISKNPIFSMSLSLTFIPEFKKKVFLNFKILFVYVEKSQNDVSKKRSTNRILIIYFL